MAQVRAEGVKSIVIVSPDPQLHNELAADDVEIYHRDELNEVQLRMRDLSGVSVLIYQQTCATQLRRLRKRGEIKDSKPRLLINPAVCEGCGDCTVQSSCVAVEPLETALGTKRVINQTACNQDLSCAKGFCPAFVEVRAHRDTKIKKLSVQQDREVLRQESALQQGELMNTILSQAEGLAQPTFANTATFDTANILITGVGGTGIVTVSALLAVAAKIDGLNMQTLDMTGLAQKGGAVFSHVRLSRQRLHTARITQGAADLVIGCDLVSAASNEALVLYQENTQVALNSQVAPTAQFVLGSQDVQIQAAVGAQQNTQRQRRIEQLVGRCALFDSNEHVEAVLGHQLQANVALLGYAYQLGGIPLSLGAMLQALRLNGTAVEENICAFHIGRLAAANKLALPKPRPTDITEAKSDLPLLTSELKILSDHLLAYGAGRGAGRGAGIGVGLGRLGATENSGAELVAKFTRLIDRVVQAESQIDANSQILSVAVAKSYAKLLAVKDEYEVARLHTSADFQTLLGQKFGENYSYNYLLAPPILGIKKRRFGEWLNMPLRMLAKVRGIRNTWLDPFRFSTERRESLWLLQHFEGIVEILLRGLNRQNLTIAIDIASLPQQMRGFGHVRQKKVAQALQKERQLLVEFNRPAQIVKVFDPHQIAA